jgi:hypothetical protein
VIAVTAGLALFAATGGCAARGLRGGEDADGPWWMIQTAMSREGRIDLKARPWWPRAAQLSVGEQFMPPAEGPAAGRMLVRRESVKRRTGTIEAIVWIIDDDADGSLAAGGDRHADCYVVDDGGDGTVDRIVDYIDLDADRKPDEMDIRYFEDGELRRAWFGVDLDGDGLMWDLLGYEYSTDFFKSDPHGDNMIYMNKYNPRAGVWSPISECPFAFYDTDRDGYSEVVVRVSAVPLDFNAGTDPDYANDQNRYQGPWSPEQASIGISNVRYSFDVDGLSGPDTPLHYDFGFNLVGARPYRFAGMSHFNPHRRPPQVTCVIPFNRVRAVADRFAARETGFSWHEHHDDTIAIGAPPRPEDDFRWEGVFWVWERRFMENTGGPNQKWNVRREWSRRPTDRRELYYSGVDRRIHLFGAEEGWLQVGHFDGLEALGEIRTFDTDGNGYFDRWEVYRRGEARPVRVTTVRDEKARRLPFDEAALRRFYTREVLPEATAAATRLREAMSALRPFTPPAALAVALDAESTPARPPGFRRYALDVACEMQFQDLCRAVAQWAGEVLDGARPNDLRALKGPQRAATPNTQTAWAALRLLERLDAAYGQGDTDRAVEILAELKALREALR